MSLPENKRSNQELPNRTRKKLKRHSKPTHTLNANLIGRRELLALLGTGAAAATGYLVFKNNLEGNTDKTFKEQILNFSWTDAQNPDKLTTLSDSIIKQYLILSESTRLNFDSMKVPGRITFYQTTDQYIQSIKQVAPGNHSPDEWGYTDYQTGKIFIDLSRLKEQSLKESPDIEAGRAILEAEFHELIHLDVSGKKQGILINNPQAYFYSPVSGKNEMIESFRGGVAYTKTYYGYVGFDEVWTDTISQRFMIDKVGLNKIIGAGDYYRNGTDLFVPFTYAAGIPLSAIYQMHATSDFEGFAVIVGEKLPGNIPPLEKGIGLFTAIHQRNLDMINKTGIQEVITKAKH